MFLLISASAPKTPARWSAEINDEWTRNLARNRPDIESKIPLLLEQVNHSVPDCLVENYAFMVESLDLPDPDDRHVLAAVLSSPSALNMAMDCAMSQQPVDQEWI